MQSKCEEVIDTLIEKAHRKGRSSGGGFYDYDHTGKRIGLWEGLTELFPTKEDAQFRELQERMLFVESLETVRCLDENVILQVADANIGSIFGIGFPAWTGGVLQYINTYPGGPQGFVDRARELEKKYGSRFTPPESLIEKARKGELYE